MRYPIDHTLTLPYGSAELSFTLPAANLAGVFTPQPVPEAPQPRAAVARALDNPLDLPPLTELIRPGGRVAILVDDHTRATPAGLILPPLLERLHQAGARAQDVLIMVTHGTHRLSTPEELQAKLGEAICAQYQVEQHVCTDTANQVFVGLTGRGTPVWVNRRVASAAYRIGIGHVGPSPYAGYSGGYKLIVPGVAALDTINANHSLVPLGLRQHGRTDLPCRQDLEEAAALVGLDFLVDVVLSQDEKIVAVFAGKAESVFRHGLELARQVYEVPCPAQVDVAITSASPYDLDLYQAVRAVEYADAVVRPGGAILLAAACPDGTGGEDFYRLLAGEHQRPEDFLRAVARRDGLVTFSVLGYALARIKSEKKLSVLTAGIPPGQLQAMGFSRPDSLQSGVAALLAEYGPGAQVAVFPKGASTIPVTA